MSAKHWRRTAWGVAAGMVATLGTAWAQAPGTERTCGMRGTTAATAGRRGSEEGWAIAAIGGSRLDPSAQLFTPVVEIPTGSGAGVPAAPAGPGSTATPVTSSPPAPAGPPALPGITPPAATSKDKDKDKDDGRGRVEATQAKGEIAEERLLDIGVAVFDTGLSERDRERLATRGL